MRPTDADALMPLFIKKAYGMKDRHGVKPGENWLLNYDDIKDVLDNAPPVKTQKIVIIPPELIEKLALCVVDIVGNIDWEKAIEAYTARPQGDCKSCRHRDPEDKKCDCGRQERQGCPFPVSDDYYCKYYEKGAADMRGGRE